MSECVCVCVPNGDVGQAYFYVLHDIFIFA